MRKILVVEEGCLRYSLESCIYFISGQRNNDWRQNVLYDSFRGLIGSYRRGQTVPFLLSNINTAQI